MFKRLKYISRASKRMRPDAISALAKASAENNRRADITGILVETSGIFFQVIEGPAEAVDALFQRISADPRHQELLILNTMDNCDTRLFPQWAMQTVSLRSDDIRADAIKLLLDTAVEGQRRVQLLSGGIERFVWTEVAANQAATVETT
ncbi:MAG: BLUF domain-containing protein [Myxococcales bacterium]|nr:BLUF domain-containing protein [Myxococcales bacterium]